LNKKILSVLTAAVLALSSFAVVSAQSASEKAEKWIEEGAASTLTIGAITEDADADFGAFDCTAEMLSHLAAQFPKDKLIGGFSVDTFSDEAIEIAVADTGIEAGKKYALRNFNSKTGEWSSAVASVVSIKSGIAKFKITKDGVYALVETKTGTTAVSTKEEVVKDTTVVVKPSPKTGEV